MFRLALQSLRFYWRPNLGVFAGTLLASAVLTGALLVGDSVDYSLRRFATLRLGGVEQAIDTRSQFVRQDQLDALKELKIIPSLFPLYTFYWGDWYGQIIGPGLAQ